MLDHESRQELLESCGVIAALDTGGAMYLMPPRWAEAQLDYVGDRIEAVNPQAMCDRDYIDSLGVVFGEAGTVITIGDVRYRALSVEAERNGFAMIELGAV